MSATLPAMPASLTHGLADAFVSDCLSAMEQAPQAGVWTLDASGLVSFDSSALAALLSVRRAVLGQGGELRVQHLPERLRELATLYGVAQLLPG